MKLLFIMKTYHDADKYFEKNINSFKNKNYQQINKIFCEFYANWLSEFYLDLEKEFNCEIIFPNNIELMKSIDCEKTKSNYFEYLEYIINNFDPDIFFTNTENKTILSKLKLNNCYKVLWKSSKISKSDELFNQKFFQHIISDNDEILKISKKNNLNNSSLLISIPDRILKNKQFSSRDDKVFFTGSLGAGYSSRRQILKLLIEKKIDIELRSRDIMESENYFEKITNFIENHILKKTKLSDFSKQPFYGSKLFNYMGQFKYNLNMHSDFDKNNAINLRVFESLSQGCLLFTDSNNRMEKYFVNAKDLIVFKNNEELIEKVNFYKNNEDLAYKISKNGFDQIKKKHTTSIRLKEFREICKI